MNYLLDGDLYIRSYTGLLMRCLRPESTLIMMAKMHEGLYKNHSSGSSLSRLTMLHSYCWSTLLKDLDKYVRKCYKCQKYVLRHHIPANELSIMSNPWLFIQWGLEIVGSLPQAPAQKKFNILAMDYFSKWIVEESYAAIKDTDLVQFV